MKKDLFFQFLVEKGYFTLTQLKKWQDDFLQQQSDSPTKSLNSSAFQSDLIQEMETISKKAKTNTLTSPATKLAEYSKTNSSVNPSDLPSTLHSTLKFLETKDPERYQILETLGEGGMGVVQRVQDNLLGREVALKKIRNSKKGQLAKKQQMMLWRLQQEASITSYLEHPNIVPLYDMQKNTNGDLYFTMRKIEGKTFTQVLTEHKENSRIATENEIKNKLLSIFLKICDAVSYAHSKGVIHRDLKPDNIMVGQFGEVYVMDWGIAKKQDSLEEENSERFENDFQEPATTFKTIGGLGTPGYMAPEQQEQASQIFPQSDIFSLGKILRQCFTLLSPLEECEEEIQYIETTKTISAKVPHSSLDEKIPLDIQAIVNKATAEKWERRYESVQEFIKDLECYRNHNQVSAREYTLLEVLGKWYQRNKSKVILVGIFLGLCLFFPLYFKNVQLKEKAREQQEILNKALGDANEEISKGKKIEGEGRLEESKKVEHFLNALNSLNSALKVKPFEFEIEEKKKEVADLLIKLCFQSQNYQLASYIAKELQELAILDDSEKEGYLKLVVKERDKILKKHLARFQFWEDTLKAEIQDEFVLEDAVFEISKMPEEEIFMKLIEILSLGTKDYLKGKKLSEIEKIYYETMVRALGRLENPKAENYLTHALRAILKKYPLKNQTNRDFKQQQVNRYVLYLASALGSNKAKARVKNLNEGNAKLEKWREFFKKRRQNK